MARGWDDPLHARLQAWGMALKGWTDAGPALRQEPVGDHPLARALEYAPGTRARAARQLLGRDGSDRRRLMARELEACGVRVVPMAYCDPVPARNLYRGGGYSPTPMPAACVAVDTAWRRLWRRSPELALVLRQEYAGVGAREDRAATLGISVRLYRDRLALAREAFRVLVEAEPACG